MFSNFTQKAYELAYAVFRLGNTVKQTELRSRLEKASLDLLEASAANDNVLMNRALTILEVFIVFGQGIGELNYPQVQVLLREIGNLNAAMRQNNAAIAELNLEEIFHNPAIAENSAMNPANNPANNPAMPKAAIADAKRKANKQANFDESGKDDEDNAAIGNEEFGNENEEEFGNPAKEENAAMRQSAIVEIMRQVQNCRIKDLISAFPGVSERTLRYDLQKLGEDDIIERTGIGPGTFYQLKDKSPAVVGE